MEATEKVFRIKLHRPFEQIRDALVQAHGGLEMQHYVIPEGLADSPLVSVAGPRENAKTSLSLPAQGEKPLGNEKEAARLIELVGPGGEFLG